MERLALALFAALGGGLIAAQAPINARLRTAVGSPLLSAAISFTVGTVILVVAALATDAGRAGVAQVGAAPWWAWVGGICGATLVTATLMAAPRIGSRPRSSRSSWARCWSRR